MKFLSTPDLDEVRFLRKPEARAAQPISTLRGSDWAKEGIKTIRGHHYSSAEEWYLECHLHGMQTLLSVIEINREKMGGMPVLVGTRFTIAQILAELSETSGVDEIAINYNLDADSIRALLDGMSLCMQKPNLTK